jgi:uncharacterized membrane protein YeaQ/YmgE (transglycosylase-associated protein family)
MIGMHFVPFLTLLIIGLVSGFVLHVAARYRVLNGFDGFMAKWIAGWIGGWLGSPVYGFWGGHIGNVYIIPALLGAFTASFFITVALKASATATSKVLRQGATPAQQPAAQFEMRKAG